MSRFRLLRALTASFGLAVLLGGLLLPLLELALGGDRLASFCSQGRCCCAGDAARDSDDRSCLRRSCGCGREGMIVAGAPLRIEAVLPATGEPVHPGSRRLKGSARAGSILDPPHKPPVPPPRSPRLA